jgi:hypothetical protein
MLLLLYHGSEGIRQGVIALAGAVIGGAIAFLGQYFLQRSERRELARRVAMGLAGEIEALISIVERRHYISELNKLAQSPDPPHMAISVARNYFRAFEANVDKLGLLGGDLSAKVAGFYVRSSAVLEDFSTISNPGFASLAAADRQKYYATTAALLEETMSLGKETATGLRTFKW